MKKAFLLLGLILLVAIPNIAGATPMVLTDTTKFSDTGTDEAGDLLAYGRGKVGWLEGLGDFVKWQHLFNFSPPADTLLSAKLTLSLFDDDPDKKWDARTWEFGIGHAESGDWDLGPINDGDYAYDVDVNFLTDGRFVVSLASLGGLGPIGGDFGILQSKLEINYKPVPEPATMFLLGLGLFGIAGARRKFFK